MSGGVLIPKLARDPARHARRLRQFPSGRRAFKAILGSLDWPAGRRLLLPAYVGWSAREGSGLFDPVAELRLPFAFYRMTGRLDVDLPDLERQLRGHPGAVLLLVHYFGRVDPQYAAIRAAANAAGAEIIEDEAHAMLTDLVGGRAGRGGRHAFLSLHKLLPVEDGGAWIRNGPADEGEFGGAPVLQRYDLHAIAEARRRNHALLAELLRPLRERVDPLWSELPAGQVPQTFPILLQRGAGRREYRDRVYALMNERGFGVVSLYHTLIDELDPQRFPESCALSRCILNLPVHQDTKPEHLAGLVRALSEVLDEVEADHG